MVSIATENYFSEIFKTSKKLTSQNKCFIEKPEYEIQKI